MITKAQLDAALSDLEKKIVRNMDTKIDAKILAAREEIKLAVEEMNNKQKQIDDEIFLGIEESLDKAKEDCCTNTEEVKILKEQLNALEKCIEDMAKEGKSGKGVDVESDDEEIKDDFSS